MQMAFVPLSYSLYLRVWCEPSNLSNLKEQSSITLEVFASCDSTADDAFIKTVIGGKIGAFKLVVRLSEAEQAVLRKSFHLLDQVSTFYQCAYRGYYNTGNFVNTSAVSQNNNHFCVSGNQPESTTTSHFVPHVTTAGDNANSAHASGNDKSACENMSSPTNSADITCPLHPLLYANKITIWVSKTVH